MKPVIIIAAALSFALWGASGSEILIKADQDFALAAAQRGAAGFVSWFAGGASILPAGGPVVTGIEGIRKVYEEAWAQPGFSLQWKPLKAEMSRSGDLGYTFGTYERKKNGPDGKLVTQTGKYMTIWKRQKDGAWKVIADMGN